MKTTRAGLLVLFCACCTASARSPDRDRVSFSITTNVGFGFNVHVVGNPPDLGSWNPVDSIKLRWTSGNLWVGQAAVQKGTDLEYKFIVRNGTASEYCNGNNVAWEPGGNRFVQVPPAPAFPAQGKTIYYYSAWDSASILVVSPVFSGYPMERVGPGRTPGEHLYRATGLGEIGEWMEFVPNGFLDGIPYWDNPPPPETELNYRTQLDAFVLQDGNLYPYRPAASVSPPRQEHRYVGSSHPPIDGRWIHVLLPRGYDSHPWKRYPVLYMQDGQNIFFGANPGGTGAWDSDLLSQRETAAGRMREAIIVGIDNDPERRRWEYNPPGDTYPGEPPGRADAYLNFLVHNVRPTIDTNYRTLNDRRNTLVGGSSMGGVFSVYAGFESTVFGGVLAMSPAFTRAPNFTDSLWGRAHPPVRIYPVSARRIARRLALVPRGARSARNSLLGIWSALRAIRVLSDEDDSGARRAGGLTAFPAWPAFATPLACFAEP